MTKMILTVSTVAALALFSGCAEKRSCCNPAPVAAPAPAPVAEAPAPAPAPVVEVPAPVEEPAPIVDEKTRSVQ